MLLGTEDKLTGLVIIRIIAFGQYLPHAWTRSRTIEAFVLNRSSRVIPVNSNIKMTKLQKSFFVITHKLCSYIHYMSITMDNNNLCLTTSLCCIVNVTAADGKGQGLQMLMQSQQNVPDLRMMPVQRSTEKSTVNQQKSILKFV